MNGLRRESSSRFRLIAGLNVTRRAAVLAAAAGTMAIAGAAAGPGGDNCNEATVVAVTVGPVGSPNTVTITGDTSSATGPDCVAQFATWWEAFEFDQCAKVTLDFCGTTPRLSAIFARVASSCAPDGSACGGFFSADDLSGAVCGDGNVWMSFEVLPPGTYYYPIVADESVLENPPGPYVMHISAEECSGACCDAANNSCTEEVVEADCTGVDQEWHPGQQCLEAGCIGACCDATGSSCTEDVVEVDCAGVDQEWHPGLQCYQTGCVGACCDTETEICTDNVAEVNCPGPQQHWSIFSRCAEVPCPVSPGPDLIVRHIGVRQLGREGPVGEGTVGLGMTTTVCNRGDEPGNFFALPDTDHPVISLGLYRLRPLAGGDRFEQIGQSWIKHGFGSANVDECGFGCTPTGFNQIGVGCSDTYAAVQIEPCGLFGAGQMGPRSAIHPYTGNMAPGEDLGPGGGCDVNYPSANHIGHTHNGISHRVQVPDVELMPDLNAGARYFGEAQYITRHEFTAGNGNQNNNVSYVELAVGGPDKLGVFQFANLAETAREHPAVDAWVGARQTRIEPAPLGDGRAFLAYQVTDLGDGSWHYEYAIYNMNMDRAIESFSVPIPFGVMVSNEGFHAPLNHAPEPNAENYSNDPWNVSTDGGAITWATDPFDVDPLANAVRFGTLYNFRFDADGPPQSVYATVGLFKTGGTVMAVTLSPRPGGPRDCNNNGIEDTCDLDCAAPGCAEPQCGESSDCDGTGVPDECEIDCNGNGVDDRCDVADGVSPDCTGNEIPDECEPDCNGNDAADSCDLVNGTSSDDNANGIPDECECFPSSTPGTPTVLGEVTLSGGQNTATTGASVKNRFISVTGGDPGRSQALRVKVISLPATYDVWNGMDLWVSSLSEVCENGGDSGGPPCPPAAGLAKNTYWSATLSCDWNDALFIDWTTLDLPVHIYNEVIIPSNRAGGKDEDAVYEVAFVNDGCTLKDDASYSNPLTIIQPKWGDVLDNCGKDPCGAPQGVTNIGDVTGILAKFQNLPGSPIKARADLVGLPGNEGELDRVISIVDVTWDLDAFIGGKYGFAITDPCDGR